jgi:hypothetical protein
VSRIVTTSDGLFETPEHLRKTPEQARCDAIQAAFRDGDDRSPPRTNPLPPLDATDDLLKLRLADELDRARRMLDELGDDLAADMGVVIRHSVALQSVDIVGQTLGHIANVFRALDAEAAVARIGMCELKARLTRGGEA